MANLTLYHIFAFGIRLCVEMLLTLSIVDIWNVVCLTLIFIVFKLPMELIHGEYDDYPLYQSLLLKFARYIFTYYPFLFLRAFFSAPVSQALTNSRSLLNLFTSIELPTFRGIWFGAQEHNDIIVFYVHGGGFAFCTPILYAEFLSETFSELQRCGWRSPAVFALDYGLSPENRFPHQTRQLCEAYIYLLEKSKLSPDRIVLAGDSAGANLILSFLLHFSQITPSPSHSLSQAEKPAFALLISPWGDLTCPSPGGTSLIADFMHVASLKHYAALYAGIIQTPHKPLSLLRVALESLRVIAPLDTGGNVELVQNAWSNPFISPISCHDWSSSLPTSGLCITYGSTELLAEQAVNLGVTIMKTGRSKVEVYEKARTPHVWPMFQLYFGWGEDEKMEGVKFVADRITSAVRARLEITSLSDGVTEGSR